MSIRHTIKLHGTPREIGRQQGEAFANEIYRCYEFYCLREGKTPDMLKPSVVKYLEERCPRLAEEIEGIAEGAGMSYQQMLLYNVFYATSGCTPVYFRNTEVGPIVAQTLDTEPIEQEVNIVKHVRPDEGYGYLGISFVGTVWAGNCINERGLCGAGVSASPKDVRHEDGTTGSIIWADIVQRAETIHQALEITRSHRIIGKGGCSILCDATGEAMLIEKSDQKRVALPIEGEFAFSTGYESGEIEPAPDPEALQAKDARRQTIRDLYERGEIEFSLEGMKKLLSHHAEHPGSVCRHEPWQIGHPTTQSARIMIPQQKKMLISDGPPCRAPFEEFKL